MEATYIRTYNKISGSELRRFLNMQGFKRKRYRSKAPRENQIVAPRVLFRTWRFLEDSVVVGRSKVELFFEHPSALLAEYPLSEKAKEVWAQFPPLDGSETFIKMRGLLAKLPSHPAHSYLESGKWKSLSVATMATFYEDAVLHAIGMVRMSELYKNARDCELHVGAALTFWHALDARPFWHALDLPDAIAAGLSSTHLAEFEQVFCLTYQSFTNMPSHITVLDCNEVLPLHIFERVLLLCISILATITITTETSTILLLV